MPKKSNPKKGKIVIGKKSVPIKKPIKPKPKPISKRHESYNPPFPVPKKQKKSKGG